MSALPQPTVFALDPSGFISQLLEKMEQLGFVAKPGIPERLWTLKECAAFLGVSEAKAKEWADEGMPHIVTNPGAARVHLRFHPSAVSEWAKARSLSQSP